MRKLNIICLCMIILMTAHAFSAASNQDSSKELTLEYLWPEKVPGQVTDRQEESRTNGGVTRLSNVSQPSLTLYPTDKAQGPVPAVLVCPGGGYSILCMDKEGTEVADWLNSIGITAVILKYRVPNNRPGALQDVQRAMGLIRQNAEKWNIDPDHLGVLGFSAGGHLSASLSTHYQKRTYEPVDPADQLSCRPDFTVLIYPAYLSDDHYQVPAEINVTENTPPAFIFQSQDDKSYIDSSIAYYLALKKADVPAEIHLFPTGGHGYGLRPPKRAALQWPKLCEMWIKSLK